MSESDPQIEHGSITQAPRRWSPLEPERALICAPPTGLYARWREQVRVHMPTMYAFLEGSGVSPTPRALLEAVDDARAPTSG